MKPTQFITRRRALIAGGAALGGLLLLPRRAVQLPPTYGRLLRMGDAFTYGAHRALLSGRALAREYTPGEISSFPATGTTNPANPIDPNTKPSELWGRLQQGGFVDWRLSVEGLTAKPRTF